MKKLLLILRILSILSTFSSLNSAFSMGMEEEDVLFETRTAADAYATFPHLVSLQKGRSRLVLSRELFPLPSHLSEKTEIKLPVTPITSDNLNSHYKAFKETNNLDCTYIGVEVQNLQGVLYIGDEEASIKRGNFLKEWRYVMDEHTRLFVTQSGNHGQIRGGEYGMGAGILKFDENGKICFINNSTGHIASTTAQLKQVVLCLSHQGMLSVDAITSRWNQSSNALSCSEFLTQDVSAEEKEATPILLRTSSIVDRFEQMVVLPDAPRSADSESLIVKALKIQAHYEAEKMMKEGMLHHGASQDFQEKLQRLETNRPYGDLFNKILKIIDHANRESFANPDNIPCHLVCSPQAEIEHYKLRAAKERVKLKESRPFPELWMILIGE